jgi:hypothetical protein
MDNKTYDPTASGVKVNVVGGNVTLDVGDVALGSNDPGLLALGSSLKVAFLAPTPVTASIAKNSSLAAAGINIGVGKSVGIIMPAQWTAADLTIQVSDTQGGTYVELFDSTGTAVQIPVAAGNAYTLSNTASNLLAPWSYIKVRSGTALTPVTQTAARDILFVVK